MEREKGFDGFSGHRGLLSLNDLGDYSSAWDEDLFCIVLAF